MKFQYSVKTENARDILFANRWLTRELTWGRARSRVKSDSEETRLAWKETASRTRR